MLESVKSALPYLELQLKNPRWSENKGQEKQSSDEQKVQKKAA